MGARILVADDSVTIQKVVELTFSKEDFQIVAARNGEEAIRKAREVRPDLMLIDLVMPDKSGYEVCEALRKDPVLKDVPIILLTGTFEAFDRNEGARVGANDFVTKPFESQALIGKVKQLLFARSVTDAPRPASPSPAQAAPPGLAPPAPPGPPPSSIAPPFERERGGAKPAAPAPSVAPPPAGGGEGEVSEEKLWELLEREEPGREPTYVLPEESGPALKLGPPVEEGLGKARAAPEGEKTFSLDEGGDLAASLKDMAESLGLPMEPPLLVDVESPAPAPPRPPAPSKPAPPQPAEDLAIPLLESLEILPEEGPTAAPSAPPPPPPPATAPRAPSAPSQATPPSHPLDVDRVTREITDKVARAIVHEVSERLAGKIERIVWEVVPDMAEHLITQEIERIKAQAEGPPEKA